MSCPFILPWTPTMSEQARKAWKANCGPHSIAAALSISLDEVHAAVPEFRGWMSPALVRLTLHELRVRVATATRVRVDWLCNGLNYIQWEGWWLDRGQPAREAYKHSHWVAHWDGWVLCTAVNPNTWLTLDEWKQRLAAMEMPWHVRAHYRLHQAPSTNGADVPARTGEQKILQFSEFNREGAEGPEAP